jgi:hypothetical protein
VIYKQLADLLREVPMDNLSVPSGAIALVVCCHRAHHPALDKHVSMMAIHGVNAP